jgi:hypothetical protein
LKFTVRNRFFPTLRGTGHPVLCLSFLTPSISNWCRTALGRLLPLAVGGRRVGKGSGSGPSAVGPRSAGVGHKPTLTPPAPRGRIRQKADIDDSSPGRQGSANSGHGRLRPGTVGFGHKQSLMTAARTMEHRPTPNRPSAISLYGWRKATPVTHLFTASSS